MRSPTGTPPTACISLGPTSLARRAGLLGATKSLGCEGYVIAVRGRRLFLVGGEPRGVVNAVYALLEEDLGCRWYHRGEAPSIPTRPTLSFRPILRQSKPAFGVRWSYYWEMFDADWTRYNRVNCPSAPVPPEWGGTPEPGIGFDYDSVVPPKEYFATHPEYYALRDGKRETTQVCLSNPAVVAMFVKRVREGLRAQPICRIVEISPNDNGEYCQCPACKALDDAEGTNMGTLLRLINTVADVVAREFPGVRVATLAYQGTVVPPKRSGRGPTC